jgi:hypothetical protein
MACGFPVFATAFSGVWRLIPRVVAPDHPKDLERGSSQNLIPVGEGHGAYEALTIRQLAQLARQQPFERPSLDAIGRAFR